VHPPDQVPFDRNDLEIVETREVDQDLGRVERLQKRVRPDICEKRGFQAFLLWFFGAVLSRCARVALRRGVAWYDDSKGTNVGATVAALRGLETAGRVVLIAGGDGKGQDFAPLAAPVAACARSVLLIGRDAPRIEAALAPGGVPLERCATLEAAVARAAALAQPGDAVLLSPACASFDMFRDYRARGDAFARAVRAHELSRRGRSFRQRPGAARA